jgi:hypothetical protein
MEKKNSKNSKNLNEVFFFEKKIIIIRFVNVETDPRLLYYGRGRQATAQYAG